MITMKTNSKMIKQKLILAFFILLPFQSMANDVVITVTGRVVPLPCTVDTTQLDMDLGKIYASALANPGSSGSWIHSIIRLSNCPPTTSGVTASFSGQPGTRFYKNSGTAQNIEIQLSSASSGTDFNNGTTQRLSITQQRTAEIPIMVRVFSPQGKATDGTIQGTINVTYTYQ